jgi:hypothetical protein
VSPRTQQYNHQNNNRNQNN